MPRIPNEKLQAHEIQIYVGNIMWMQFLVEVALSQKLSLQEFVKGVNMETEEHAMDNVAHVFH